MMAYVLPTALHIVLLIGFVWFAILAVGLTIWSWYLSRAPRPFDWERDAPEFSRPKERHVRVVSDEKRAS